MRLVSFNLQVLLPSSFVLLSTLTPFATAIPGQNPNLQIRPNKVPGTGEPKNLYPDAQQPWPAWSWPADVPIPSLLPAPNPGYIYKEPFLSQDEIGEANCNVMGPKAPLVDCIMAMAKMPRLDPDVAMRCPADWTETGVWQHGWCRIALIDTTGLPECIHPFDMHLAIVTMLDRCSIIPQSKEEYKRVWPLVAGYMAFPLPYDWIAQQKPGWDSIFKREIHITRVPDEEYDEHDKVEFVLDDV
ncbi:hypothetical protein BJ508DRAFT_321700 [Ascobolus immersus RN42]|uniref:Uncharacterized protein n=1 Tax=Ascobolus immersus RN42 TaxID=1160509 RepID=A0A3N4IKA6_ASCIM|nr:hypothetical protein BJ508DRAFT_321700 [Ascobolus immersus RN42]